MGKAAVAEICFAGPVKVGRAYVHNSWVCSFDTFIRIGYLYI